MPSTRPVWTSGVRLRLLGFLALLLASVVAALALDLPSAAQVRATTDSYGWAAPAIFIMAYALITLAPVPKNVLSAAAGVLFGLAGGTVVVWSAAMAGSLIAFALGRLLGRDAVELLTSTRVRRVDELIVRRGLLAVVAVRLVPVVPFTAVNYTAGLTGIHLWQYAVGTAVGIVPGTVAYVALGTYGGTPGSWPFLVSLAVLVVLSGAGVLAVRRRRWRPEPLAGPGVHE